VQELLSYVFSPLREGDIALFRGFRHRLGADPACCRGSKPRPVASRGLNTNMRSRENLTPTGRRDRSR